MGERQIERQANWIFKRALNLIQEYESKDHLTDEDFEEMVKKVDQYYKASHNNKFCQGVLLSVLAAFEEKEGKYKNDFR